MPAESIVELNRKQLYDEIWEMSAAGAARKYNVPYAQFLKQIKAAGIPTPPSGYWVALAHGKPVQKTELAGDADQVISLTGVPVRPRKKKADVAGTCHAEVIPKPVLPLVIKEELPDQTATPEAPPVAVQPIKTPQLITHPEPETYQHYGATYNVYDRETLYHEVWEMPVTEVAKRYRVSDVAIHKMCKSMEIPTPPLGYWAKLRAGKPVEKFPLPPSSKPEKKSGLRTGPEHPLEIEEETLAFMNEDDKAKVLAAATRIMLPDENQKPHQNIVAYGKKISEWHKQHKAQEVRGGGSRNSQQTAPFLSETVSEESLPRIFRIIDALAQAMVPLGCSLTEDLYFIIDGEDVLFNFTEARDEVEHVLTKEENMQMLRYEEEKQRYSWASKPTIRKYDRPFNGRISFVINEGKTFRDTKVHRIEERLGDILIQLYEASNVVRKRRLAYEEAERKRQEEARLREERVKRYEREVARTCALENEAEDFAIASNIRAYIAAIEAVGELTEDGKQWVEWAKKKADWYDPVIARTDECFGKREHGKNTSEKQLRKTRSYWGSLEDAEQRKYPFWLRKR